MRGLGKKPSMMASVEFDRVISQVSKAALVDAIWCACHLGSNDTHEEILTSAARNLRIALQERGDRVPADVVREADKPLESDPEGGL